MKIKITWKGIKYLYYCKRYTRAYKQAMKFNEKIGDMMK